MALTKFHPQLQWLASLPISFSFSWFEEPPHCQPLCSYQVPSSASVEVSSLLSTPSPKLTVCKDFDYGHSDWVWGDTLWYFEFPFLYHLVRLTSFHGTCLEQCDWNLPVEIDLLKICPSWTSFPLTSPRTLCEGKCFLLAAPWALWFYGRKPEGDLMSSGLMLIFFCCNFIVSVYWSRVHLCGPLCFWCTRTWFVST